MTEEISENVPPIKEINLSKKESKKHTKPRVSAAALFGLAESKLKNKVAKSEPAKPKQSKKPETPVVKSEKETDDKKADEVQETKSMTNVPEEWTRPFKLGWRREIVYRGVQNPTKQNRQCDIYYFTPENAKLRSIPMIADYLAKQKSDLTKECFTFSKKKIFNEPQEMVRNAGDKAVSNKKDENQEVKVVPTKKVKSNISIQPSEKISLRRKSRKAEKENVSIENSLNDDSMKEDIKEIMSATMPILDTSNKETKKKAIPKGKKRKNEDDSENLSKKVKFSDETESGIKHDDLASNEDSKELLSLSLPILDIKTKKSNRGRKRKSGGESENAAKKVALSDETESSPKQDGLPSNCENTNNISDLDSQDHTNVKEESHANENESVANDSMESADTSNHHDKSVEDEMVGKNDVSSDDNISEEMFTDEKSQSNCNDITMDDETTVVDTDKNDVEPIKTEAKVVENDDNLDEIEVDKEEISSEREEDKNVNNEKISCDKDENLFKDELSEDKENHQDTVQASKSVQLNEDRVFRDISDEQENFQPESTEDTKKIDDAVSNELTKHDNIIDKICEQEVKTKNESSDKEKRSEIQEDEALECSIQESDIESSEYDSDDSKSDKSLTSLHSFVVDKEILSLLDVSKKFYLHIENEKRLIEPGCTFVDNSGLNIRLKVPLPQDLMKRNLPSLCLTVEKKDDMQILIAKFVEK